MCKHTFFKSLFSILAFTTAVLGFSASLSAAPEKLAKQPPPKQVLIAETININKANARQISEALKGIGLKKAEAIVEWRKANGKFTTIEQLIEVKGIGEKILQMNKQRMKL